MPTPWPSTLADARQLIKATFAKQNRDGGWDARSIRFYLNAQGIRPPTRERDPVGQLDADECRTVLMRMWKTRMIIFQEQEIVIFEEPVEEQLAA